MFFIIGISPKHEPLGRTVCMCHACGKTADLFISKKSFVFTFFFIRLIPFGASYFAECPNCGSIMALSKEKGKAFERDTNSMIYPGYLQILHNTTTIGGFDFEK